MTEQPENADVEPSTSPTSPEMTPGYQEPRPTREAIWTIARNGVQRALGMKRPDATSLLDQLGDATVERIFNVMESIQDETQENETISAIVREEHQQAEPSTQSSAAHLLAKAGQA